MADPYLIVLPTAELSERVRYELDRAVRMSKLSPVEVIKTIVTMVWTADYGQVLTQVRTMMLDEMGDVPDQQLLYSMVDALSDVHGALHSAIAQIHREPYRMAIPMRMVGNDIVFRIVP